ncbi:class IV adenylate cyclase [Candidatus Woesearchaeota archaeon]|nr:class IV adenylate cyclase [Candidatus Woesearchaeota archaeon]
MAKEIEIKFKLDEDSFLKIKEKIKKISKFVKISKQKDEYFTPSHRNFMAVKYPFEWLSIRERGSKTILNYKHFYPENVKEFTHCDEVEHEVGDAAQLKKIFSALDFKSLVIVEKEREVYNYNDFEIGMDTVKEAGHFIEIEAKKDFGSVEKTREKLFEFAKSLDIDISKADNRGYPYILMKIKGLIK